MTRAIRNGVAAGTALAAVNGGVILLVSGVTELRSQFASYWPYQLPLVAFFGFQVGLWTMLKERLRRVGSATGAVIASGASGTVAMIACCSHYLAGLIPLIAVSGVLASLGRLQPLFYGIGIAVNAIGALVIIVRLRNVRKRAIV